MSDTFYKTVRFLGSFGFWSSGTETILGIEHVPREGAFILAPTHTSYFDVPILMRHTPRLLDTVTITEVFKKPTVRWFYSSMNTFPLDRSRADPAAVRTMLDHLRRGRAVLMFPEGAIRTEHDSAITTGRLRPGLGRIAKLANTPVVPAVVINSIAYHRATAWLPGRRTRYGIAYGPPLRPTDDPDHLHQQLVASLRELHSKLAPMLTQ